MSGIGCHQQRSVGGLLLEGSDLCRPRHGRMESVIAYLRAVIDKNILVIFHNMMFLYIIFTPRPCASKIYGGRPQ